MAKTSVHCKHTQTDTTTVSLKPGEGIKTAQPEQCAACGPTVGVFVIQGGPEVELGASVDKEHVSVTHNARSV